jgi:hypothetical protein
MCGGIIRRLSLGVMIIIGALEHLNTETAHRELQYLYKKESGTL